MQKEGQKEGREGRSEGGRKERRKENKPKAIWFCFTTIYCAIKVRTLVVSFDSSLSFIPYIRVTEEKVTSTSGHDGIIDSKFTLSS